MRVTRLAVYFAGFSASVVGEILSADFLPRPRVSICSSFPTTERRALSKRNCATQSMLTQDLSFHESALGKVEMGKGEGAGKRKANVRNGRYARKTAWKTETRRESFYRY